MLTASMLTMDVDNAWLHGDGRGANVGSRRDGRRMGGRGWRGQAFGGCYTRRLSVRAGVRAAEHKAGLAPSSSLVQDISLSRIEQGFESPWGHSPTRPRHPPRARRFATSPRRHASADARRLPPRGAWSSLAARGLRSRRVARRASSTPRSSPRPRSPGLSDPQPGMRRAVDFESRFAARLRVGAGVTHRRALGIRRGRVVSRPVRGGTPPRTRGARLLGRAVDSRVCPQTEAKPQSAERRTSAVDRSTAGTQEVRRAGALSMIVPGHGRDPRGPSIGSTSARRARLRPMLAASVVACQAFPPNFVRCSRS